MCSEVGDVAHEAVVFRQHTRHALVGSFLKLLDNIPCGFLSCPRIFNVQKATGARRPMKRDDVPSYEGTRCEPNVPRLEWRLCLSRSYRRQRLTTLAWCHPYSPEAVHVRGRWHAMRSRRNRKERNPIIRDYLCTPAQSSCAYPRMSVSEYGLLNQHCSGFISIKGRGKNTTSFLKKGRHNGT
jgi:hypothetical protein